MHEEDKDDESIEHAGWTDIDVQYNVTQKQIDCIT